MLILGFTTILKRTKYIVMTNLQTSFESMDMDYMLSLLEVEETANQTGFYQRSPQKITASSFIKGFLQMQQKGKNTLRNWAVQVGSIIEDSVRKQSIDNRLQESGVKMSKELLKKALNTRLDSNWLCERKKDLEQVICLFNNIIIQDSTLQKLPSNLHEKFGGNMDTCSQTRIQALFNFSTESWLDFSVDTYSQNDQSQAKWGFDKFEKNDLIIRDLGYFVLDALEQLCENQYIITSYKPGVSLFTASGIPIDLLKLLKSKKEIDMPVLVGKLKKIPLRLVARKLSKKQKNKRIQEAKNKKKSTGRKKYSKEYFDLLGYELFLTNIEKDDLDIELISKLYGLRWYIEILFKSWKSYFNFKSIFEKNQMTYHRTLISLYLVLIGFVLIKNNIYPYIKQKVNQRYEKQISILKFMDVVNDLFFQIINIKALSDLDKWIPIFANNTFYEKRTNRKNMKEKYQYINNRKKMT